MCNVTGESTATARSVEGAGPGGCGSNTGGAFGQDLGPPQR